MAADSVSSVAIPGLTESPAEQTRSYPLSNGITVGSQESEGYGSGSQATDGQPSTTSLEDSSDVTHVGQLTEPEMRVGVQNQGGATEQMAAGGSGNGVSTEISATPITQASTVPSTQFQDRPPQSVGQTATTNSTATSTSSGDTASSGNNPQGLPGGQKRLHVSNLPFRFRDADLTRLFEPHGRVVEAEIIFNERGSKGFGFVTFDSPDEADNAKEKVNGSIIDGRKIEVNDATPRTGPRRPRQQPPYGGDGGTYRYNRPYGMGGLGPYGRPMPMPMRPSVYDSMPGARTYGGYPQPEMTPSVYPASYGAVSAYPGYPTDAYQSTYGQTQGLAGQYSQGYLGSQQAPQQTSQTPQQPQQQQQQAASQQQPQQQESYPGLGSAYGPVSSYQQQSYRYAPY